MPISLRTERLLLRELNPSDTDAILAIFRDPEVVEYTEWSPFATESDATRITDWAKDTAQKEPRSVFALALVLAATPEIVIGVGTLIVRDTENQDASLGYLLGMPWWGQGFATEVARGLIRFGFTQLGLHRIHAHCRPENTRSIRVLEKLSMQREGHLRQNRREKGQWHDTLIYAILQNEWSTSPE